MESYRVPTPRRVQEIRENAAIDSFFGIHAERDDLLALLDSLAGKAPEIARIVILQPVGWQAQVDAFLANLAVYAPQEEVKHGDAE